MAYRTAVNAIPVAPAGNLGGSTPTHRQMHDADRAGIREIADYIDAQSAAWLSGGSGSSDVLVDHATPTGTTETLDLSTGNFHRVRWDANVTLSLANVPSGLTKFYLLLYHENTTTSYTVTWWAGIEWTDDAAGPILPAATANAEAFIQFWTVNGGTAWRALHGGNFFP